MSDRATVTAFLKAFKQAASGNKIEIVSRNSQGLLDLNLPAPQAKEFILTLTPADYCSGPEADRDEHHGGEVWVFGKMCESQMAYTKLKLEKEIVEERAVCLSIHPAEHEMKFPHA